MCPLLLELAAEKWGGCLDSQKPSPASSTEAPVATDPLDGSTTSVTAKVTTTAKPTVPPSSDEGSSTGTYIGIAAGVVVGLGLIGAGVFFLMKRKDDDEDDDPVSPGFKDINNSSNFGASAPAPYKPTPTPPNPSYEPAKAAPSSYMVHEPQQRPNPSPVPILQAPAAEYRTAQINNSAILNTFRSAQEDNSYEHLSSRNLHDSTYGGSKAWSSAMHEESHHEATFDHEFESSSYNSSANHSAFNDDFDSQSEVSRDSSFGTRNSFQSHMSSDLDHTDFPVHKESNAERGSYEL
ncbi:hypothetical protein DYB32_002601 [Aphanomyces invadans]|uniref:Uncharacterized protein n=1 Tax=Aphanomyces invadans TaxID=157072 RepID=A0A3R6Z2N3_9STRA|nr:hypothetical protein DYB32_002601 [Aphanomyces invadans]